MWNTNKPETTNPSQTPAATAVPHAPASVESRSVGVPPGIEHCSSERPGGARLGHLGSVAHHQRPNYRRRRSADRRQSRRSGLAPGTPAHRRPLGAPAVGSQRAGSRGVRARLRQSACPRARRNQEGRRSHRRHHHLAHQHRGRRLLQGPHRDRAREIEAGIEDPRPSPSTPRFQPASRTKDELENKSPQLRLPPAFPPVHPASQPRARATLFRHWSNIADKKPQNRYGGTKTVEGG